MESPPFAPHGGTVLEVRGRILVFRSKAHLNSEEVRRLQQEVATRLKGMAGQRWAILGVVERAVLLTADAETAGREALPQMMALGLCAQAVAFRNPADRPLIEAQVRRIVAERLPVEFFDDEAAAEAWLNATLAAPKG